MKTVDRKVRGFESLPLRVLAACLLLAAILTPSVAGAVPAAGIEILEESVRNEWPKQVVFTLRLRSSAEVRRVRLVYSTSYASRQQVALEFEPGTEISVEHVLQTSGNRYLPPGTLITYWYTVDDVDRGSFDTEPRRYRYLDSRFPWESIGNESVTVLHDGNPQAATALRLATEAIADSASQTGGAISRPFTLMLYRSAREMEPATYTRSEDLRGNALGVANWTYDVLLVGDSNPRSMGETIAHEVAHLSVQQAAGGPYLVIPSWLNEGLASRYDTSRYASYDAIVAREVRANRLPPLSTFNGYPSTRAEVEVLYPAGLSMVRYLVRVHGIDGIARLLSSIRLADNGRTINDAFTQAYGEPLWKIENDWRASVGAPALPEPTATPPPAARPIATPIVVPTYEPVQIPTPRPAVAPPAATPSPAVAAGLAITVAGIVGAFIVATLMVWSRRSRF